MRLAPILAVAAIFSLIACRSAKDETSSLAASSDYSEEYEAVEKPTPGRTQLNTYYLIGSGKVLTGAVPLKTPVTTAKSIQVQLYGYGVVGCGARLIAVHVTPTIEAKAKRYEIPRTMKVELPSPGVAKLAYEFENSRLLRQRCAVDAKIIGDEAANPPPGNGTNNGANNGGATPPPPAPVSFELKGALEYKGGFEHKIKLGINQQIKIKRVRFDIPEFCKDVTILEAGVEANGKYETATLVDPKQRIYELATASAANAEPSVVASLNGPGTKCTIPTYVLVAK